MGRYNWMKMENDQDQRVENVAKALYQHALERARIDAGKYDFDLSDAISVFRKMTTETDTGIAIVSAAYFDECLKNLFFLGIDNTSKSQFDKLVNFGGPLGTFSSRINLAFGFSMISKDTHQSLDSIRKIRNEFAHSPFDITFNTERIRNKVIEIKQNHKKFLLEVRKSKKLRNSTKPPSRLIMKEMFLIKSAMTLAVMASEMIVFPVAKQNRVSISAIMHDYDNLPDNLKNIRLDSAKCIFEIFGIRKY